jgi:FGGY-family pentulose kinase
MKQDQEFVVGVDVGTLSTRAGIFNLKGAMMGSGSRPIANFYPQPDYVEQSSEDIWENTGLAIREASKQAQIHPGQLVGISFDATCSLVCLDKKLKPLTISSTGDPLRNIIVWMDHRAIKEADFINQTKHPVLAYVGGKISPEQQPPKLKWVKENLPETWARAGKFMDLADFMVFRATGQDRRSLCTNVCKWTYLGHEGKKGSWDFTFFEMIGLGDLFGEGKVPKRVYPVGSFAGTLTKKNARELGLRPGVKVGVGIIDAHAGGIGLFGNCAKLSYKDKNQWNKTLALIGGTSSCHMVTSFEPRFIPGVWGPYWGAMIPDMWLNEGGQSATGSLIDYVIKNNSSYKDLKDLVEKTHRDIYQVLNQEVRRHGGSEWTKETHVLPYHHGNRSPRADAHAKGMMVGLTLDQSVSEVAKHYYATVQAIAYGTRHIIEVMNEKGYQISDIYMCGGHTKNQLFIQEHADITGCSIYLPEEKEAVLLGTAILASVAAKKYRSVREAIPKMSRSGEVIHPNFNNKKYHDARYRIFKLMYEQFKEIRTLSDESFA